MDLDPDNNFIVLGFEYVLSFDKYIQIWKDWREFITHELEKQVENQLYKPKVYMIFCAKTF